MEKYSTFKESGWRLFIKFMKDYYHHEFEEIPNNIKDEFIEYILLNNASIFETEDVLRENLCTKCGECCRQLHCVYLDKETNLCKIHDNQESPVCSKYPWDEEIGFTLSLNCGYQKLYVIKFLNRFFKKYLERCNNEKD